MYSLPARHKKTVAIRHNPQKSGIFYVSQSFFKRDFYTIKPPKTAVFRALQPFFTQKSIKKHENRF